jgi:hypothetical protein
MRVVSGCSHQQHSTFLAMRSSELRFVRIISQKTIDTTGRLDAYSDMIAIAEDFLTSAVRYGQIIISEGLTLSFEFHSQIRMLRL